MNVFWHRRDLRIRDNRGLARAAADGDVLPVFVVEDELLRGMGDRKRAFLFAGLEALREAYRERGGDLLVKRGDPALELASVRGTYDVDTVYYNRHYLPARHNRERRVDRRFPTVTATDLVLVDPDDLAPSYPSHSRFYDDWSARPKPDPAPAPDPDRLVDPGRESTLPTATADIDLPPAGYEAARARYDRFLADGIETYADTRDDLSAAVERPVGAVSRLSPYLAAGMIGVREVWADATDRHESAAGDARRNVEKFRYELSWREANYHLLANDPDLLSKNHREFPNPIAWRDVDSEFERWKRGETGYPLVDAGMRQLDREGYVHNRPRQVVASFLTKHLLVDWRRGARHFEEQLLDHDHAVNYGNWQWVASTGTDTVDVRIFDPVAQMDKYDPRADYVREYVPELRGVPAEKIVEWPTLTRDERRELAPEYPDPVVDRDDAYERAQRVFEAALGKR
ncbi:MAG: deoxyribodipyrimidine photo-lyase [Haloarculaceae archaeon]